MDFIHLLLLRFTSSTTFDTHTVFDNRNNIWT